MAQQEDVDQTVASNAAVDEESIYGSVDEMGLFCTKKCEENCCCSLVVMFLFGFVFIIAANVLDVIFVFNSTGGYIGFVLMCTGAAMLLIPSVVWVIYKIKSKMRAHATLHPDEPLVQLTNYQLQSQTDEETTPPPSYPERSNSTR